MLSFIQFITELYQEEKGGTFEDDGTLYDINKIFKLVDDKDVKQYSTDHLDWIIPDKIPKTDRKRSNGVDTSVPIIVTKKDSKNLVVDGYHRLIAARDKGISSIPGKYISREELSTTKV